MAKNAKSKAGSAGRITRVRLKSRKTRPQNRLGVLLSWPGGKALIDARAK
jgi:hypothetical protein